MARTYCVYILASQSRELHVGMTNDVYRRVSQHRTGLDPNSYTAKHRTFRLVYCESTHDPLTAIRREKQIKKLESAKAVGVDRAGKSKLEGPC